MADETFDDKAGPLTPRDPSLEDVVEISISWNSFLPIKEYHRRMPDNHWLIESR